MIKSIKGILYHTIFVLLCIAGCQTFDSLGGVPDYLTPPEPETGYTSTVRPLSATPVSMYQIDITFDGMIPMDFADPSNFAITGGSAEIISVSSMGDSNLSLYLTNQTPGERYSVSVKDITLMSVESVMDMSDDMEEMNTNEASITNYDIMLSDGFTVDAYGTDDREPPELELFYPTNNVQINTGIGEKLFVLGYVFDNLELEKIEYKIDNGEYIEINDVSLLLDISAYPYGQHQIIVRATDIRGNTSSAQASFEIYSAIPQFYITAPTGRVNYDDGESVTVEVYATNDNIYQMYAKFISPEDECAYFALSESTPDYWSGSYIYDYENFGETYFVAMMITTNEVSVPSTNFTTNTSTFYDGCIYVSGKGSDTTNNGTRLSPFQSYNRARSYCNYLSITNMRFAEGDYGIIYVRENNRRIDGGYSPDFLSQDRGLYPSSFSEIDLRASHLSFKNIVIEGGTDFKFHNVHKVNLVDISLSDSVIKNGNSWAIVLHYTSQVKISRVQLENNAHGMNIYRSSDILIDECDVSGGKYGIVQQYTSDTTINNSRVFDNKYHRINLIYGCTDIDISYSDFSYNTCIRYTNRSKQILHGDGGGLWIKNSTGSLRFNEIHNNTAYNNGGGIYMLSSDFNIEHNDIYNNESKFFGGGICCYNDKGSIIQDNTIAFNETINNNGGGCFFYKCTNGQTIYFQRNDVFDNNARYGGGLDVFNCININCLYNNIYNNEANYGGGIYILLAQSTSIGNCYFHNNNIFNNKSFNQGGGIYNKIYKYKNTYMNDNIITNNHSEGIGGGILIENIDSSQYYNNNIIDNNQSPQGGGIYFYYKRGNIWFTGGSISGNSEYGIYSREGAMQNLTLQNVETNGNTPAFKNW